MKITIKAGQRFGTGNNEVIIKKVYPKGHRYASKVSKWYLIYSPDFGEDTVSEHSLIDLI